MIPPTSNATATATALSAPSPLQSLGKVANLAAKGVNSALNCISPYRAWHALPRAVTVGFALLAPTRARARVDTTVYDDALAQVQECMYVGNGTALGL